MVHWPAMTEPLEAKLNKSQRCHQGINSLTMFGKANKDLKSSDDALVGERFTLGMPDH